MAYTVNWITRVISIPKADLTLVDAGPPEIRELTIDALWTELRRIQATTDGIHQPDIFIRIASATLGGLTFAPALEIINSYTLEFEDGQYTVNITEGNTNVSDVKVQNQVSVNTFNSAGLAEAAGALAVWSRLMEAGYSAERYLRIIAAAVAGATTGGPGGFTADTPGGISGQIVGTADESGNRTPSSYGT